jgi:hypothetical protein
MSSSNDQSNSSTARAVGFAGYWPSLMAWTAVNSNANPTSSSSAGSNTSQQKRSSTDGNGSRATNVGTIIGIDVKGQDELQPQPQAFWYNETDPSSHLAVSGTSISSYYPAGSAASVQAAAPLVADIQQLLSQSQQLQRRSLLSEGKRGGTMQIFSGHAEGDSSLVGTPVPTEGVLRLLQSIKRLGGYSILPLSVRLMNLLSYEKALRWFCMMRAEYLINYSLFSLSRCRTVVCQYVPRPQVFYQL